ncbi:hypothetical protein R0K18_27945, partial [Pantoea sp. SIMBA_133]
LQAILLIEAALKRIKMTQQIIPISPPGLNRYVLTEPTHRLRKGLGETGLTGTTNSLEYMQLTHR